MYWDEGVKNEVGLLYLISNISFYTFESWFIHILLHFCNLYYTYSFTLLCLVSYIFFYTFVSCIMHILLHFCVLYYTYFLHLYLVLCVSFYDESEIFSGETTAFQVDKDVNTFTVHDLLEGNRYKVWVKARSGAGVGPSSDVIYSVIIDRSKFY